MAGLLAAVLATAGVVAWVSPLTPVGTGNKAVERNIITKRCPIGR